MTRCLKKIIKRTMLRLFQWKNYNCQFFIFSTKILLILLRCDTIEKIIHYDTSAMKHFLTSVSLQHEPKASDVITLVKKTFFRTSIVRNFISRGVKMRISAREAWYNIIYNNILWYNNILRNKGRKATISTRSLCVTYTIFHNRSIVNSALWWLCSSPESSDSMP